MFIDRIWIRGYKGVDCSFSPGSATVFFGPNDSGKSNILESVHALLTWKEEWRRDPLLAWDEEQSPVAGSVLLKGDDSLLDAFLFLDMVEGRWNDERGLHLGTTHVGTLKRQEISVVTATLRREILRHGETMSSNWGKISDDYAILLDAWLASRWFVFGLDEAFWMYPPPGHASESCVAAARSLDALRDLWSAGAVPIIDAFVVAAARGLMEDQEPPEPDELSPWFVEGAHNERSSFFDVVHISSDAIDLSELAETVQEGLVAIARARQMSTGGRDHPVWHLGSGIDETDDIWFEPGDEGWFRIAPGISDLCVELGRLASEIAPPFVRDHYEVAVQALTPNLWGANAANRIRFLLHPLDGSPEGPFDLRLASSGISTWAAFAIREALRRLQTASEGSPSGASAAVVLIDEPERHLHPEAQRQAADWLSEEVLGSAQAFLATHALPFLDLRRDDVEYMHVVRRDGKTSAASVTTDILGVLSGSAVEAGVSLPELLQLTRAVLVVEGAHDEKVLNACCGREFPAERVQILKLFGVREALSLGGLTFLDKHSFPIVVMFDNIWRDFLDGKRDPRTGEERGVARLQKALRELAGIRDRLRFVPFEEPDVLCALPDSVTEETLRRHWPESAPEFQGWGTVTAQWTAAGAPAQFKEFFASAVGIPVKKDTWKIFDLFLERALAVWGEQTPRDLPRPSLVRAVNETLAIVRASTYDPSH